MRDEWIDISKVDIPIIKDKKQERIIIREYIPPVREGVAFWRRNSIIQFAKW